MPFFRHSGEGRNPVFSGIYKPRTPFFNGVTTFYEFIKLGTKNKSAFLLLKEIDAIVKPISFPLLLCKGSNLSNLFQKNVLSRTFH